MKFNYVLILLLLLVALFVGGWAEKPESKSDEVKIELADVFAAVTGELLVADNHIANDALVQMESNDFIIAASPPKYNGTRHMNTVSRLRLNNKSQENTKLSNEKPNRLIKIPYFVSYANRAIILLC